MKLAQYKDITNGTAAKRLVEFNCYLAHLTHSQRYQDTLQLFHRFRSNSSSHHLNPDHYTLASALTGAANLRATTFGDQLHAYSIRVGLKSYPHVANTLLSLYAKSEELELVKRIFADIQNPDVYSWTTLLSACTKLGEVEYACQLFDQLTHTNAAVWNAIITGCAENGRQEISLDVFQRMRLLGVQSDNYTFASVLSLCCCRGLLDFGRQVHNLVIKTGFLVRASVVNALLTMYFDCGSFQDACEVFEEADCRVPDQITYNAMISGLASAGRNDEALIMFKDMQHVCLRLSELTFVSLMSLYSCARVAGEIHAQAIKNGFEGCTSVSNAAITMYSGCGDLCAAKMVFQSLEEKDIVSWNAMITSYAQWNLGREAVLAYLQMQRQRLELDEFTIGSLLASSESLVTVGMFLAIVFKNGLIIQMEVSNALVSAFSKHGDMTRACQIFDDMCPKNMISWNTIISGFQINGFPEHGLQQFSELLRSGLQPNAYTLSVVLSICAGVSSLRHGKEIHSYIIKFGFLSELSLGNALITLYAKCGNLNWSLRVFSRMPYKDIVSWNSIISAHAHHGQGEEAVQCFEAMQQSVAVKPDKATFTAILSACSHAGLVEDGIQIFNSMVNDYGSEPTVDHFSCIVDLLGRSGYLDMAEKLTDFKHIVMDPSVWWTLFGSCAAHGNIRLGKIIASFLLDTEQDNASVYIVLSNLYANAGQWVEAANLRTLMKSCGVIKQSGLSWIGS